MALPLTAGGPTLLIRREAWERSGLTRQALDERLGLTDEEFRVEGSVIAVGPVFEDLGAVIEELEGAGLTYYDDFFEIPGGWPGWLSLFAGAAG